MQISVSVACAILCLFVEVSSAWDCFFWQYECANGKGCYEFGEKCDGKFNCADQSDEIGCRKPSTSLTTVSSITKRSESSLPYTDHSTTVIYVDAPGDARNHTAYKNENVGVICATKKGQENIQWYKPDAYIKKQIINGVLLLKRIGCDDAGTYVCYPANSDNSVYGTLNLHVDGCQQTTTEPTISLSSVTSSSPEPWYTSFTDSNTTLLPCKNISTNDCCCVCSKKSCTTTPAPLFHGFRCSDGAWVELSDFCNGHDDCRDGSDEFNCSTTTRKGCTNNQFQCGDGECISYSKFCDGQLDCFDGSDEGNCYEGFFPKIIELPQQNVHLDCLDPNKPAKGSGVLELECKFIGKPMPKIKWRRHNGQVPLTCNQSSTDGHGILKCSDFQQSDQGAYSCVAENVHGMSESQPRSIVKCNHVACDNGFTVIDEHDIESCIECFCSGIRSKCSPIKSKGATYTYDFPTNIMDVFVDDRGAISLPFQWNKLLHYNHESVKYCFLSRDELLSAPFTYSYGKNLNVPVLHPKTTTFLPNAPDVIIVGNESVLKYTFNNMSRKSQTANIRFWTNNWNLNDNRKATRNDIMQVLSDVDSIFIRCEYTRGQVLMVNRTTTIELESSEISKLSNSVSYVEKCECPKGYDGLSCQKCSPGYEKVVKHGETSCVPSIPKVCDIGYKGQNCNECDVDKLYYRNKNNVCVKSTCQMKGSFGIFPDDDGICICKENVEGQNCDRCKSGYFNLNQANPSGCSKCWCNDLDVNCESSEYTKATIASTSAGGYNSSNGGHFWLLPREFNGNKLTSYGGYLEYSLKYLHHNPRESKKLTVEILSMDGESIRHIDKDVGIHFDDTVKTWKVAFNEAHWLDRFDNYVSRSKFMRAISYIKAIYIESPDDLSSDTVIMDWVKLDVAEDLSNGISLFDSAPGEKADQVEKCFCPPGYAGLSCESCADGYYRQKTGNNTFICAECTCAFCDPEKGCMDCNKGEYRDNPKSDGSPICRKCPCNDNEESCSKDEYNLVICFCKTGFSGIHCETELSAHSHLDLKLTPTKVINKKAGSLVVFTCSYNSTEDMYIEFERHYKALDPLKKITHIPGDIKVLSMGKSSSVEIAIDEDLESVDCVLTDSALTLRARASALVVGTITDFHVPQITNCYNEPKYVNVNEDLELICEVTGSPAPQAEWYIVKNNDYTKVDTVDGVHMVTKAQLHQNGTLYVCIANNSVGDDKCPTYVIVKERCLMTVTPVHLRLEEGEDAQFDCITLNKEPVTWKKVNGFLPYDAITSNGALNIKKVSVLHAGEYECSANSIHGEMKKTVKLEVTLKKVVPKALIQQEDATLRPGDNFTIDCNVTGQPAPVVKWTKINDLFLPDNVQVDEINHSITINNANEDNIGIYECRAESEIGSSASRIHVNLMWAVPRIKIEPENVSALPGKMVTVQCIVLEGKPVQSIKWFKINNIYRSQVLTGDTLRFPALYSVNAGRYECEVVNSAGKAVAVVDIDVMSPPKVVVSPDGPLRAYAGENHDFFCNATGSPKPKITWTYAGSHGIQTILGTEDLIRVVVTNDMKYVTCTAENPAGSDSMSVDIKVKIDKDPSTGIFKRIPIGSRAELIFPGLDSPFDCTRIRSSLVGDECYIKNGLEIPSVQIQHNGTYICSSESGKQVTYAVEVVGFVHKFSRLNGSYILLPLKLNSQKLLTLEVTLKIESSRGIILVKRKHRDLIMYLMNGRVRIKLNKYGKNRHFTVESNKLLKTHVWYTIVFKLQENAKAELFIYDEQGFLMDNSTTSLEKNTAWTTHFDDDIYLGGSTLERRLPLRSSDVHLEGCISRLIINDHEYKITEESKYSRNVSLCNVCSSSIDPCGDEGVCVDAPTHYGYVCVCGKDMRMCPESCRGLGCETRHDLCELVRPCKQAESKCVSYGSKLQCRCPAGFSGNVCDTELLYEFSFGGDGYAKLPHHYLPRNSLREPEVIEIEFTQNGGNALLLFQGNRENYLMILANTYYVQYIYQNQGHILEASGVLNDGKRNRLLITRSNNTVEISLDDTIHEGKGEFATNRVHGDIYIGGVPKNLYDLPDHNMQGFSGCIHSLAFGYVNGKINIMGKDIVRHKLGRTCDIGASSQISDISISSYEERSSDHEQY